MKRSDLKAPALEAAAADSRFGDLLTDPAFAVDKQSETYKRLNPMGTRPTKPVQEDDEEEAFENFEKVEDGEEEVGEEEEEVATKKAKKKGPALYELADERDASKITSVTNDRLGKRKRERQTLEERLKTLPEPGEDGGMIQRHTDGAMQLTFVPKTSAKKHKVSLPTTPKL